MEINANPRYTNRAQNLLNPNQLLIYPSRSCPLKQSDELSHWWGVCEGKKRVKGAQREEGCCCRCRYIKLPSDKVISRLRLCQGLFLWAQSRRKKAWNCLCVIKSSRQKEEKAKGEGRRGKLRRDSAKRIKKLRSQSTTDYRLSFQLRAPYACLCSHLPFSLSLCTLCRSLCGF